MIGALWHPGVRSIDMPLASAGVLEAIRQAKAG